MINDYYKDFFSSNVVDTMRRLQMAISRKDTTFSFSGCSPNEIERVMYLLPYEYPLTFNVFLNELFLGTDGVLNIEYHDLDEDLFYTKLNEIQEELQNTITSNHSKYEMAKIIYDYITTRCTYEYDVLNEGSSIDMSNHQAIRDFNNEKGKYLNIYGPVVEGRGVCAGFSQLYKYLLNAFGIDATCIVGYFNQNGETTTIGHAIVLVEIDDKYGYVDVAAGMKNASELDVTLYDYFMVSREAIGDVINPMFTEYQLDFTTDGMSYHEKYNLVFNSVEKLLGYFNNIINHQKHLVIYTHYTGKNLTDNNLRKMVNDIVGRKKGYSFDYNFILRNKKLTIKVYQEKRGKK